MIPLLYTGNTHMGPTKLYIELMPLTNLILNLPFLLLDGFPNPRNLLAIKTLSPFCGTKCLPAEFSLLLSENRGSAQLGRIGYLICHFLMDLTLSQTITYYKINSILTSTSIGIHATAQVQVQIHVKSDSSMVPPF